jgi:regulator of protease activity HflC (stomatin/prohibitin superfamily)
MAIKAILSFLIAVFALGGIGGGIALIAVNASRGRKTGPGITVMAVGLIVSAILIPLNAGLVLIQPNEVGVVFRQTARGDQALLEPLQPGLSWVVPFVDQVIIYDVGQQSVTMAGVTENYNQQGEIGSYSAVRAISKDGQTINLDVTVIFRLDPVQINQVHRNWRNGYLEAFIVPQARSEVRNVVSLYSAEEIYSGGRATLENQIFDGLTTQLQNEGFLLTDVLIRDISFSPEFTNAIEQKQIAEQQAQQAAFRVQQAAQEAEQARVTAQGQADASVIAAQGEAEGIRIRAEAQAEALRMINEILAQNPNLIQWQYISQLGDQVRLIIVPSNSPFLFDIQQLMEQAGAQTSGTPLPTPAPAPETQP